MTELEEKLAFAKILLRMPKEPLKAALAIFADPGLALKRSIEWAKDPVVIAEQGRLLQQIGPVESLPDKSDFARAVWELSQNGVTDDDIKIKALRLYGEIRGFIEKPVPIEGGKDGGGLVVNITQFTTNNTQVNQAKPEPIKEVAKVIIPDATPINSLVRLN